MIAPAKQFDSFDLYTNRKTPSKARPQLAEALAQTEPHPISARYDAERDTEENRRYWEHTDSLDADAANDHIVRKRLRERSRYEMQNNGYYAGIMSTYCNDLVSTGPTLRMMTGSQNFNQMVEREWLAWTREIQLRQKLWTMCHSRLVDGESFGVIRRNPRMRHRIKIDVRLYEADQCHTPYWDYSLPGRIDGLTFDELGNPEFYDLLRQHPGSRYDVTYDYDIEQVPARLMLHWFQVLRPGQHRGVPALVSTLNCGASSRRWREAVIAAAENIADFSLFLKTAFEPDAVDSVAPMSELDITKRMLVALPSGWEAFQPKAEQPTANHQEFLRTQINEMARPLNMPFNKAACDSSDYNFASGRLDHSTYYGSLDVERLNCDDRVLNPLFDVWFDWAVVNYGWLTGDPATISRGARAHSWDWPKHQVADVKAAAQARQTELFTGQKTLFNHYADNGMDYEDELIKEAQSNGIDVETQRKINLIRTMSPAGTQILASMLGIDTQPAASSDTSEEPPEAEDEQDEQ